MVLHTFVSYVYNCIHILNECTKVQNPIICDIEMRGTESVPNICEQKTETKEKEARCLTLSHICRHF